MNWCFWPLHRVCKVQILCASHVLVKAEPFLFLFLTFIHEVSRFSVFKFTGHCMIAVSEVYLESVEAVVRRFSSTLLKGDSNTDVFLHNLRNFQEHPVEYLRQSFFAKIILNTPLPRFLKKKSSRWGLTVSFMCLQYLLC